MSATLWNSVLYVPFLWVDNRISPQCFSTFFFLFYTDSFPWRILTSLQQYKVNVLLRVEMLDFDEIEKTWHWYLNGQVTQTTKTYIFLLHLYQPCRLVELYSFSKFWHLSLRPASTANTNGSKRNSVCHAHNIERFHFKNSTCHSVTVTLDNLLLNCFLLRK